MPTELYKQFAQEVKIRHNKCESELVLILGIVAEISVAYYF